MTTKTSCTLYWPLRWHKQLPTSGISQSCGARLAKEKRKKTGRKIARPGDYDGVGVPDAPGSAPTVTSEEEKE